MMINLIIIYVTLISSLLYQPAVSSYFNDNRIIGGRPALPGEFPYQVSVRRSYSNIHFCGGSVINSLHVLTAAHCLYYLWGAILPPRMVEVVVGQLELNLDEKSVIRNVAKITIHPNFTKETMQSDLAVIKLRNPLPANKTELIQAVPLNTLPFGDDNLANCVISGWGVKEFGTTQLSDSLLATQVRIISKDLCQMKYAEINVTIYDGMLCASFNEDEAPVDACQGDSGGPLVCHGKLAGIVSTGHRCGDRNFPGIYTNIEHYLGWIRDVTLLSSSANDGGGGEGEKIDSVPGVALPTAESVDVSGTDVIIQENNGSVVIKEMIEGGRRPHVVIYYDNRNVTQITIINNEADVASKMSKTRFFFVLILVLVFSVLF